jgi:predicted site-specific integrase-resolvase
MTKQDLLSTKEAAEILHVSDQTVINWWREGLFPNAIKLNPTKRNSPIRIPRKDVDKAFKTQERALAIWQKAD